MTKKEAIKEIEEYITDADKAIGMDKEYIRGWKTAMLVALGIVYSMEAYMDHGLTIINQKEYSYDTTWRKEMD